MVKKETVAFIETYDLPSNLQLIASNLGNHDQDLVVITPSFKFSNSGEILQKLSEDCDKHSVDIEQHLKDNDEDNFIVQLTLAGYGEYLDGVDTIILER